MDAAWQVSIMKKISLYLRFRLHWRYIAHFCKIQSGDFELWNVNLPPFHPHLLESIGELNVCDLLGVLELEEAVAAVAGHVHQDVGALVR